MTLYVLHIRIGIYKGLNIRKIAVNVSKQSNITELLLAELTIHITETFHLIVWLCFVEYVICR